MGLATVLGFARRGYFIPSRYPPAEPVADYMWVRRRFDAGRTGFAALLADIERYASDLQRLGNETPPAPRWDQDWFPRLDGAVAYSLVRDRRPRQIVEIGSGHSTRFLARAIRDQDLDTTIICLDPAPRATLAGLRIEWHHSLAQRAGRALFDRLAPGDFVVIDSSHVGMPGSDVDWLVNVVLPTLPAGVLVHFHDIFLPDGYPESWAWRGYNEQLIVGALLAGEAYETVFASHFVATAMREQLAASVVNSLPLLEGAYESSLWLRKVTSRA
ncbi:MAG: class I SAM-dependent methyltransferase [Alphaproteobacteria bacterium]|nr:class I SAM-dependent methyltransferase [Alphaproteobacteria bacterium]